VVHLESLEFETCQLKRSGELPTLVSRTTNQRKSAAHPCLGRLLLQEWYHTHHIQLKSAKDEDCWRLNPDVWIFYFDTSLKTQKVLNSPFCQARPCRQSTWKSISWGFAATHKWHRWNGFLGCCYQFLTWMMEYLNLLKWSWIILNVHINIICM